MEVNTETSSPPAAAVSAESTRRTVSATRAKTARRLLRRLGVGCTGLIVVSGTAHAHSLRGHGGDPATFAVVVGLPILAGLCGGGIAIRTLRGDRADSTGQVGTIVLGGSLVVLGLTLVIPAVIAGHWLGLVGGAVGGFLALWITTDLAGSHRHGPANMALGAVSIHRLLEGIAIGALYSAGAAIGLVGAVIIAVHTTVETTAVSGLYANGSLRPGALAAVVVVQAGYAGGAIAGFGIADGLPPSTRTVGYGVAGGVLLIVGIGLSRHPAEQSID